MPPKVIDDRLSVGPQMLPEDLPELARRGFRSILCARPDDEDPGQPRFAEIAAAAGAVGLEARHVPVTGRPGPAQVAAFEAAMDALPAPTYAYCRSGARAAALAEMSGR